MSAIFEDKAAIDESFFLAQITPTSIADSISLRVLEWRSNGHRSRTDTTLTSATDLIARDKEADCDLRIVLAPLHPTRSAEHKATRLIYEHYDIPSQFVALQTISPQYAFGHRQGIRDPYVEVAWTHFLCKDILPFDDHNESFHDNYFWIACDTYLHVRQHKDESKSVTLFLFDASSPVVQRFERLLHSDAWSDAVQEPYILIALVYEQCFLKFDEAAWTLASWFRSRERGAMDSSSQELSRAPPTDFATLHEIAKHCIYLSEAADAAVQQMDMLISHLSDRSSNSAPGTARLTKAATSQFQYQRAAFRSTQLRLRSLDKRIANVISLSFNLVTQRDSQVMRQDSNAMKAIAVLTLVFLPLTGIASLFSTPFFEVNGKHLWVSASFWIFWVITVCLTVSMIASFVWWYRKVKARTASNGKRRLTEKIG